MMEQTSLNLNQERYITGYYRCKGCTGVSCKLSWKKYPNLFSKTNSVLRIPNKYRNCNLDDKYYSSRCKLCQVGNSISNYKTREGMIRRGRNLQELKDEFKSLLLLVNKVKRANGEMPIFVRSGLYDDITEDDVKIRTEFINEEDKEEEEDIINEEDTEDEEDIINEEDVKTHEDVVKMYEDVVKIQEDEVKIQDEVMKLQQIVNDRCKKLMEIKLILDDVKNKLSM